MSLFGAACFPGRERVNLEATNSFLVYFVNSAAMNKFFITGNLQFFQGKERFPSGNVFSPTYEILFRIG